MRKSFISLVLILFTAVFLSACSILPFGHSNGYRPQHHTKKKVKDCGCEVINHLPKTFYIA